MVSGHRSNESNNWNDALDPVLVERLSRPLRGGIIGNRLSRSILGRIQRMAHASPLLSDLTARWANFTSYSAGSQPVLLVPYMPRSSQGSDRSSPTQTEHPSNRPIVAPKARQATSQVDRPEPPVVQPVGRAPSVAGIQRRAIDASSFQPDERHMPIVRPVASITVTRQPVTDASELIASHQSGQSGESIDVADDTDSSSAIRLTVKPVMPQHIDWLSTRPAVQRQHDPLRMTFIAGNIVDAAVVQPSRPPSDMQMRHVASVHRADYADRIMPITQAGHSTAGSQIVSDNPAASVQSSRVTPQPTHIPAIDKSQQTPRRPTVDRRTYPGTTQLWLQRLYHPLSATMIADQHVKQRLGMSQPSTGRIRSSVADTAPDVRSLKPVVVPHMIQRGGQSPDAIASSHQADLVRQSSLIAEQSAYHPVVGLSSMPMMRVANHPIVQLGHVTHSRAWLQRKLDPAGMTFVAQRNRIEPTSLLPSQSMPTTMYSSRQQGGADDAPHERVPVLQRLTPADAPDVAQMSRGEAPDVQYTPFADTASRSQPPRVSTRPALRHSWQPQTWLRRKFAPEDVRTLTGQKITEQMTQRHETHPMRIRSQPTKNVRPIDRRIDFDHDLSSIEGDVSAISPHGLPIVHPQSVQRMSEVGSTPDTMRDTSATTPDMADSISRTSDDDLVHRRDNELSGDDDSAMRETRSQPLLMVKPQTGHEEDGINERVPVSVAARARPSPTGASPSSPGIPIVSYLSSGSLQRSRENADTAPHAPRSSTDLIHISRAIDSDHLSPASDPVPSSEAFTIIQRQIEESEHDVDVEQLTDTIYRKLMRRLSIERERRGGKSWL